MAAPTNENSTSSSKSENDEDDDPVEKMLKRSGCLELHYAVQLARDYLPDDFQVEDLRVGDRRHILAYTTTQLNVLKSAKTWYMDGTFKVYHTIFSFHWLKRNQRKATRQRQGKIFAIWDAYDRQEKTTSQLLREIGRITGPHAQ